MPGDQPRSWPHRYRVTVASGPGESSDYTVATWFGDGKAVHVAVAAYRRTHGGSDGQQHVRVTELGPVAADESGLAQPEASDLLDRAEW